MKNLLLLDLDGTTRTSPMGGFCPAFDQDQLLIPEVAAICETLHEQGWKIRAVTNQGGCEAINEATGRTYKDIPQICREARYFMKIAPWCDRVYTCPNYKESDSDDVVIVSRNRLLPWGLYPAIIESNGEHPRYMVSSRYQKPGSGMIELAKREYAQELRGKYLLRRLIGASNNCDFKTLMVGDWETDRQAALLGGAEYVDVEVFKEMSLEEIMNYPESNLELQEASETPLEPNKLVEPLESLG